MYEIKRQIYLNLTKNQKSALCNYLRAFVKRMPNNSTNEILNKFIEDEKYYLEQNCSRFEFLKDYIDDNAFLDDTIKYLDACKKYYNYREKQQPIIEANKKFEKEKKKFLHEVKMSKEAPTKKQLYFYDKLCKKYNIEKIELTSKLQARDEIDKIIEEHKVVIKNDTN